MASSVLTQEEQPISRTYQYRKVMKPMLERKRRARINRCLDELKELLVGALQAEGESVSRLEKADVLELTVRHLHKLRKSQHLSESAAADRFRAGFSHCANEVAKYVTMVPASMDMNISARLLSHLDSCLHRPLTPPRSSPLMITNYTPPSSPQEPSAMSPPVPVHHHQQPNPAHLQMTYRGHMTNPPPVAYPSPDEPFDLSSTSVWRPW